MPSRRLIRTCLTLAVVAPPLAGCEPTADNSVVANEANESIPLPPLPVAEPPVDRAGLLLAVARAASAFALGQDDSAEQRKLDGKRFEVRLRFGCPSAVEAQAGSRFEVRFDEDERTLRLRAAPDLRLDDPAVTALAGTAAEAVEGFWITRPWLLDAGCPAASGSAGAEREGSSRTAPLPSPADSSPAARSGHSVGIARIYTETDPRTGRRDGRAYEATKVLPEGEGPSPQGYDLVLSGRLRQLPGGRVVACRIAAPDTAPQCLVSAQFDRVWIENPATSAAIAEWSS